MGVQTLLRNLQDKVRNAGWRIQWIPWQEAGRPEYVYNTPLTLITGLGGAGLFIAGVLLATRNPGEAWADPLTYKLTMLGVGVAGLLIAFLGRIYAAFAKQRGWKRVTAKCLDREVRECQTHVGGERSVVWDYRLLCSFDHEGREYTVTPESSHTVGFNTEASINRFLDERIRTDNTCSLWIDTKNPLHAVFHRKQRI